VLLKGYESSDTALERLTVPGVAQAVRAGCPSSAVALASGKAVVTMSGSRVRQLGAEASAGGCSRVQQHGDFGSDAWSRTDTPAIVRRSSISTANQAYGRFGPTVQRP
jgi:hypothetical protein